MRDFISHAVTADGQKARAVFDRLNSLVNIVVGAANTVAGKAVFDAVERVRGTAYDKGPVRYNINRAVRMYYEYEHMHMRNYGDRKQLFYDYLDCAESGIQKDVDILRLSIKSVLDKYGQTDTELKAYVEAARDMLAYACHIYDIMTDIADREAPGYDFKRRMSRARLTGVLKRYEEAADLICRPEGDVVIDLNTDRNVRLAFKVIETKLTGEDYLNRAGYEALRMNPGCRKYIAEEDYKELEERFSN